MTGSGGPHHGDLRFRADIQGLRALAILAVIAQHIFPAGIRSGFLGVDLFFAISGYLIVGGIVADLERGRFSVARFYQRRVRRIIPALIMMLAIATIAAILLMLPDNLENFGQSLAATALFGNNVLLTLTAGYFTISAPFKPLIHSWSLGVEEQFYLLVPLVMLGAWRLGGRRGVIAACTVLAFLSLLASYWLARHSGSANFYLIFSRGWELLAGALAALLEPQLRGRLPAAFARPAAAAGLAIAVAFLFVPAGGFGPNLMTVPMVAGLCIVLALGDARGIGGQALSVPPLLGIGAISYSLYLYQQPFFAFARLLSSAPPTVALHLALLVPIFLCAFLSWRFVEQPFRDPARTGWRTVATGALAGGALLVGIGVALDRTGGLRGSWPEYAGTHRGEDDAYNMAANRFADVPLPVDGGRTRILVIGNSFARDFINMGLESHQLDGAAINLSALPLCAPVPQQLAEQVRRADYIVIANTYAPPEIPCVARVVHAIHGLSSQKIVIIDRKSFGFSNNSLVLTPRPQRYTQRVRPSAETVMTNKLLRQATPETVHVDLIALLADGAGTIPAFTPDGKFISWDTMHFTRAGAAYVGSIAFHDPELAGMAAAVRAHRPLAPPLR